MSDLNRLARVESALNGVLAQRWFIQLSLNQDAFWDNNFVMLKEDNALFSPLSVLNFSRYENIDDVKNGKKIRIDSDEEMILLTHKNEVLAIYEKDEEQHTYRCLRGLW